MTYLDRYQSGEYEQVWAELTALGEQVRQEPILSDALAVAYETMSRVRENVKRIVLRLQSIGYQFDTPEYVKGPYTTPATRIANEVDKLERLAGPLPLSLRARYEMVGNINLTGMHPDWPGTYADMEPPDFYTDPLVIEPIEVTFFEYEDWKEWVADEGLEKVGSFSIHFAPDIYHKADISGGGPYEIQVPSFAADAILLGEWHSTTLVNYLRECFRWGGFPGFDIQHPMNPQHLVADVAMPPEHLALLTSDLLPR